MKLNFTFNDLIRFIYKETSMEETLDIQEALCEDALLRNEYDSLLEGYQKLPKVKFRPSKASIQNILDYSAISHLEAQL